MYLPRIAFGAPLPILALLLVVSDSRAWLWTQAVGALILLFPVMGLVLPTPRLSRVAPADAPRMRVMSYNINSGGGGTAALMAEIDRYAPDVVVMVEVGLTDDLIPALRQRYPTVESGGQFLTAARYPLTTRVDPEKLAYGGRQRSPRFLVETFDTPLGPVAFYVVHPISPREDRGAIAGPGGFKRLLLSGHFVAPDGPGKVQANAGLREAQIRATTDLAARDPGPVVVAGDTNLPGLSRVARQTFAGLSDGFLSAGSGFGYTYPTKHPFMRIDRILANDKLEFTHFEVGTSNASDHLCVVADLTSRR
jgi:endonuclease/exonuclease/phosphatase (EEP) superfamily protein YafD